MIQKVPERETETLSMAIWPGGGMRGYMSVRLAEEFTKHSNCALHESFDEFHAISVGAINAASLWPLKATGEPPVGMEKLKDIYLNQLNGAFRKNKLSLCGLCANKYDISLLYKIFDDYLGDTRLSDYHDGLYIYAINADDPGDLCLSSLDAKQDPRKDFKIVQLLRGVIAAPYYFELNHIQNEAEENVKIIDAGLITPDPTYFALEQSEEEAFEQNLDRRVTVFGTGLSEETTIKLKNLSGGASSLPNISEAQITATSSALQKRAVRKLGNALCRLDHIVPNRDLVFADIKKDFVPHVEQAIKILQRDFAAAVANAHPAQNTPSTRQTLPLMRRYYPEIVQQEIGYAPSA